MWLYEYNDALYEYNDALYGLDENPGFHPTSAPSPEDQFHCPMEIRSRGIPGAERPTGFCGASKERKEKKEKKRKVYIEDP